jgi:hypothetical protein
MKVRTTIAGTAFRAKLTALCWGALTILAPVAISSCSGSTSTPTVSSFSPTVATLPASDGTTSSNTPGVTTPTATPVATVTQTVTVPAATATSFVPTAAPVTGGGGTAGLQDGLLFVLGAAAILAGAGSILYRRRFTRHR